MVPPAGFKPTSYALEERCLIQLDHSGMLLLIQRLLYYPLYESGMLVDCSRVELLSCLSYKHLLAIYTVTAHIETHLYSATPRTQCTRLLMKLVCFYMAEEGGIEPQPL